MVKKERYQNRIELLQGTLDLLILQTLQWGPQHGYGITQAIRGNSGEVLQVDTGSLYPALHRLERQRWIKSEPSESMMWSPGYRAEGTLAAGTCRALFVILDMNSDGVFDRRDFAQGSAVGIDINGDGKIYGKGEYLFGGQVFEFCGKSFYVDPDSLAPDGSAVTVVETSLTAARLNAPIPPLEMRTTGGATLRSQDWRGKVVLLDFWASWCNYCIAEFPVLKDLRTTFSKKLEIVSINTDEPAALEAARKIMNEHKLPWPQVVSGKGLSDPVWMVCEGIQGSMPLYVLIDREGFVRYGGAGGEGLSELRAAIQKLVQ
jgi:thiol-disulfide isomerase/thioredoxin